MKCNIYRLEKEFFEEFSFEGIVKELHRDFFGKFTRKCVSGRKSSHGSHNRNKAIDLSRQINISCTGETQNLVDTWSYVSNNNIPKGPNWLDDFQSLTNLEEKDVAGLFDIRSQSSGCFVCFFPGRQAVPSNLSEEEGEGTDQAARRVAQEPEAYAITFGDAWRTIKNLSTSDFGIKVAANLMPRDRILSATASEVTLKGRKVHSNTLNPGYVENLKIDFLSESITALLGEVDFSENHQLSLSTVGKIRMDGSASLTFNSNKYFIGASPGVTLEDFIKDIKELGELYYKKDYLENHSYLENFKPVPSNSVLSEKLLETLFSNLKVGSFEEIVVDIQNADPLDERNYSFDFVERITNLENLKKSTLNYYDLQGDGQRAKIINSLRASVDYDSKEYLFINGRFYEINKAVIESIDNELGLIDYADNLVNKEWKKSEFENELKFNQKISMESIKLISLDQVFYQENGISKFEVCDLLSDSGEIIHVKKNSNAANISHVCQQIFNTFYFIFQSNKFFSDFLNLICDENFNNVDNNARLSSRNNIKYNTGFKIENLSDIDRRSLIPVICLAGDWEDGSTTLERVKNLSFLRKTAIVGLRQKLFSMGYKLSMTSVIYSDE